MGIIVNSPYSGQPVKVRDQDVGRAVRDEENRIFYVLPKRDGSGYYGAVTRAGGEKDELRAAQMASKQQVLKEQVHQQVHDATGKMRSNLRGKLVIAFLVLLVLVLVWLFTLGPLRWGNIQRGQTPPPNPIRENWQPDQPPPGSLSHADELPTPPAIITTATGLRYAINRPGAGVYFAEPNSVVTVNYTGTLADDTVFASTLVDGRHKPVQFVLGAGQVIEGLEQGIAGMSVGERRMLVVPPHLAQAGANHRWPAAPGPDQTLRLDVELVSVKPGVEIHIESAGSASTRSAEPGDLVVLQYTSYLEDLSVVIDSSHLRRRPLAFVVGAGQVIDGLDAGVKGMHVGEQRTVMIPPYLAYGERGFGAIIPPNTALLYEVQLVEIAR